MRILFACGGTAGHINPALAVASTIREEHADAEIAFAGNPNAMENRLVNQAGFEFLPFRAMGFQRKLSFRNIRKNVKSLFLFMTSAVRAKKLIRNFSPDLVIGTGGYVSEPILKNAHRLGIKTVTHEQNAFPGLATKMLVPSMNKVLLASEDAKKYLPQNRNYLVVGNPVRPDILNAERDAARRKFGIDEDTFCLLSFGGSLGAMKINEAIADVMIWHCKGNAPGKIRHIHASGAYWVQELDQLLKDNNIDRNHSNLDIREYIDDMPDCLAAADLVVARSGAITLSELECAGKASILIPSPNVAENHQYHNAMALVRKNAASLIEEKDLTSQKLIEQVEYWMTHQKERNIMADNAKKMALPDAAKRIAEEALELIG